MYLYLHQLIIKYSIHCSAILILIYWVFRFQCIILLYYLYYFLYAFMCVSVCIFVSVCLSVCFYYIVITVFSKIMGGFTGNPPNV